MTTLEKAVRHPRKLNIDASTLCQLHCPTCPTAGGKTRESLGADFLRMRNFKSIVDQNPSVAHIELSNWGEIFLNPELEDILKYAYRKHVAMYASNGTNLNHADTGVLEALVKYKFRRLCVSIDGTTQETYSTYRRGGSFENVLNNVRTINRFKKKYRSEYPRLVWQFVVFGHNEHEIGAARKTAAELGMDFRPKLAWGDLYESEAFSPVKNAELVRAESGLAVSSREEYQEKYGQQYYMNTCCSRLWTETQINHDGRLLGCPINFWSDYGNVLEDGLESCMQNSRIAAARDLLMGKEPEAKDDLPCLQCQVYSRRKAAGDWLTERDIPLNFPRSRLFVMFENRVFGPNITTLGNLWRAVKRNGSGIRSALRPWTVRASRAAAVLLPGNRRAGTLMRSGVYPLHIPLPQQAGEGWNVQPLFHGQSSVFYELGCHASALSGRECPHPPHIHKEEELLLLFAGELDIIYHDEAAGGERNLRLLPGQFIYYPAGLQHTVRSCGDRPANYAMFKWRAGRKRSKSVLGFSRFSMDPGGPAAPGFAPRLIFEGRTAYLKKLHCHASTLAPGAGYEPHCDPYDVAVVVLEGAVETLGRTVPPHGFIFYAAGEPHGMRNAGDKTARYIVFEFHG